MSRWQLPSFIDQTTLEQAILFGLFWATVAVTVVGLRSLWPGLSNGWLALSGLGAGAAVAGLGGWRVLRRRAAAGNRAKAARRARNDAETRRVIRAIKKQNHSSGRAPK